MSLREIPEKRGCAGRWLVSSGVVCLLLAGLCVASGFITTIIGMRAAFQSLQTSPATPVAPESQRFTEVASVPSFFVFPLAAVGVFLLIIGVIVSASKRCRARKRDE